MQNTQAIPEAKPASDKQQKAPVNIRHAVILAAGNGERFREKGIELPKVLLKVGGLRLLERTVLTLKEAGIEHFRIVTGTYGDQIRSVMNTIDRIKALDIEYVNCEDFHLGNGRSFAAGAAPIEDPFLLTMSDHVFTVGLVKEFIEKAKSSEQNIPALACDPMIDNVYDLDDATKVKSQNGKIVDIGKQISSYNLIDTGIFYYPANSGPLIKAKSDAGAHSNSDIVSQFINETGFRAISLESNVWQDVDYPGMKAEAEKRLVESLKKTTDGWVSKNINRHISTRISLFLSRWNFTPNMMTTFVFFFTLWGAYLAATGGYLEIALGGLIFQIASILDGCDGELARLKLLGSRFGAWYDTLTDNVRYILFFAALGYNSYLNGGPEIYLIAPTIFMVLAFYVAGRMAWFTWNQQGALTNLVVTKKIDEVNAKSTNLWDRLVKSLRGIDKQDVSAFIAFILCIVGLHQVMFWLVFVGSIVVSITVTRSLVTGK